MRNTKKYSQAVKAWALAENVPEGEVRRLFGDYQRLYASLYLKGYRWDTPAEMWRFEHVAPPNIHDKNLTGLPCKLRVMGDTFADTDIAADYVIAALQEAGAAVTRISNISSNKFGDGARCYIEVEL